MFQLKKFWSPKPKFHAKNRNSLGATKFKTHRKLCFFGLNKHKKIFLFKFPKKSGLIVLKFGEKNRDLKMVGGEKTRVSPPLPFSNRDFSHQILKRKLQNTKPQLPHTHVRHNTLSPLYIQT